MHCLKYFIILLFSLTTIMCKSEDKFYLINYPTTTVYPNSNLNPSEKINLPYLTQVQLTTNIVISRGVFQIYEIKYNNIIGYTLTRSVSNKNQPPFVPNIIFGKDKLDFQIDKKEVLNKSYNILKSYPLVKVDVEKDFYYSKEPVYFSIIGIGCQNEKIKTIRVVFQSAQFIDSCVVITYRFENDKIDYEKPSFALTEINLDNIYNEYKDIRNSYCSD